MKPLDLDGLIRKSIQEGENKVPLPEREERDRTWNRIRTRLENRPRHSWLRYAALILFLLVPAGVLMVQNTRQKFRIMDLRNQIIILQKQHRETGEKLAQIQNKEPVIVHDTVRLIQPAIIVSKTDTVEVTRYLADTVVVFKQSLLTGSPDADQRLAYPKIDPRDALPELDHTPPEKSEFILTRTKKDLRSKPGQSRSFSIVFGSGNAGNESSRISEIRAKL